MAEAWEEAPRASEVLRVGVALRLQQVALLVAGLEVHQHHMDERTTVIGGVGTIAAVHSISSIENA